jgi:ubiquinone/menaquinone biosynthesis C-methylase UbiE/DNA-binding transcriptional ArsR family regulator
MAIAWWWSCAIRWRHDDTSANAHMQMVQGRVSPLSEQVSALSLLADESRLRLCGLLAARELCVSDLVRVTGISQSRVSTHLGRLREAGFVRDRRAGQQSYYAIAYDTLPAAAKLVLETLSGSLDATLRADQLALEALDSQQLGVFPNALAGEMERHYSPGRTWQSLALGLSSLLDLGDVLDIGCADGAVAASLAPRCRSLVCIDNEPRMVKAAQKRLASMQRARAMLGDAQALPFANESFDCVLLFHTLAYAEHPEQVLVESRRVLRLGGRVTLLSLDSHAHPGVTAPFGERHQGFSARTLCNMLKRAGFADGAAQVVCRETKKPHFQVVLATAKNACAARLPEKPLSATKVTKR